MASVYDVCYLFFGDEAIVTYLSVVVEYVSVFHVVGPVA